MPSFPMPETRPARAMLAATALAAAALAGCGHSQKCEFDDRPRGEVWQAVVQACREPRYADWIVVSNEVSVSDADSRVSVYRDVRRSVDGITTRARMEERKWRFYATVSSERPTTVTLESPDWRVPAHFWREADHFFGQVRMRLTEMGPVLPAPGDPIGGAAAGSEADAKAPGHKPEPPPAGGLASP